MEQVKTYTAEQLAAIIEYDRLQRGRAPMPLAQCEPPRKRIEIATTGSDEFSQGIGHGPQSEASNVGLRVPALATPNGPTGYGKRYTFLLALFSVGEGRCAVVRGFRQLLTIGQAGEAGEGGTAIAEFPVTSPFWCFPDGNASWHLKLLGAPNAQGIPRAQAPAIDQQSFKRRFAETPCCLYETATVPNGGSYTALSAYTPPNGGIPYGSDIQAGMGTFFDIRTQWTTHGGWYSLDIPVVGPQTVAFIATIKQTNPSGRAVITPPDPFYAGGLLPEDQFVLNFPNAIYWRVGGSLIVEEW